MEDKEGGHKYNIETLDAKYVADYARMSLAEVYNLNFVYYLILRRDAFIFRLSQSEKGLEYLDNAWRLEQTEPDREGLRAKFGRKGEN